MNQSLEEMKEKNEKKIIEYNNEITKNEKNN